MGVARFDVIAMHQVRHRRLANVVGVHTAKEIVQQTLPQSAAGHRHAVHAEGVDDGRADRQATGKDRRPLGVDGFEIDGVDMAGVDQVSLQRRQTYPGDGPVPGEFQDRVVDCE